MCRSLKIISTTILLLIPMSTIAQMVDLYGTIGYGFGMGGWQISSITLNENGSAFERDDKYLNYGRGIKYEIGTHVYFMENLTGRFGVQISQSVPSYEISSTESVVLNSDTSVEYKPNMYGLKASLLPRFEVLDLIYMYTGAGIGLYIGTLEYEKTRTIEGLGTQKEFGHYESFPSLGFVGTVGGDLPLTDFISLFGEVGFEQLFFIWTKREIETTNITGSEKATVNFQEDATDRSPPPKVSGSNWQIRLGLRIILY